MDQDAIIRYVTATFAGVEVVRPTDGPGAGDTFFFYDPRRDLDPTRRLPFATIVTKDYRGWDEASQLHRPGCSGSTSAWAGTPSARSSATRPARTAPGAPATTSRPWTG